MDRHSKDENKKNKDKNTTSNARENSSPRSKVQFLRSRSKSDSEMKLNGIIQRPENLHSSAEHNDLTSPEESTPTPASLSVSTFLTPTPTTPSSTSQQTPSTLYTSPHRLHLKDSTRSTLRDLFKETGSSVPGDTSSSPKSKNILKLFSRTSHNTPSASTSNPNLSQQPQNISTTPTNPPPTKANEIRRSRSFSAHLGLTKPLQNTGGGGSMIVSSSAQHLLLAGERGERKRLTSPPRSEVESPAIAPDPPPPPPLPSIQRVNMPLSLSSPLSGQTPFFSSQAHAMTSSSSFSSIVSQTRCTTPPLSSPLSSPTEARPYPPVTSQESPRPATTSPEISPHKVDPEQHHLFNNTSQTTENIPNGFHGDLRENSGNNINGTTNHHQMCWLPTQPENWVRLNVGGKIFLTTRATLSVDKDSMLAKIVDLNMTSTKDDSGAILIDRDPKMFPPLLNFLRTGKLILDQNVSVEGLLEEARFYNLRSVLDVLTQISKKTSKKAYSVSTVRLDDETREIESAMKKAFASAFTKALELQQCFVSRNTLFLVFSKQEEYMFL
eukprot:TRINITY_DN824_c0_g2_i1.p1 TRINITY_DN824_c0_g2~~TRINITY_DN824_c0_g2_i1.p1  ORF type:complete len:553 (-),score=137.05 TRINITY_DN824_c0_g2_i1:9-1667(-)